MKISQHFLIKNLLWICIAMLLSSCARDLSSGTYTSNSTLNIVLSGQIVSMRKVKIKESDKMELGAGAVAGGIGGAAAGHAVSNGDGMSTLGGAAAGAIVGAVIQHGLETSSGIEYIVKVDTSKLNNDYYEGSALMRNSLAAVKATGMVTVVQAPEKSKDPQLNVGQKVLVIISEKRVRVIADQTTN